MLKLFCAFVLGLGMATAVQARDWEWTNEYREFASGEVLAALPEELKSYANETTGTLYGRWEYAVAPAGLSVWISAHCAQMIEAMGVENATNANRCVMTHYLVNQKDPGRINVGDRWLLWSPDNDPATVQAAFAARDEVAAAAARAAEPITRGEAQELLRDVVVSVNIPEESRAVLEAEVKRQPDLLAPDFTVTDETIKELLASVLLERGEEIGVLSFAAFSEAMQGVNERIDVLAGRMAAAEAAIADQARINTGVSDRLTALASDNARVTSVLEGHAERLADGEARDVALAAADDNIRASVAAEIAAREAADAAAAQAAAEEAARVDAAIAAETAAREAADAGLTARADATDTRITALTSGVIAALLLALAGIGGVVFLYWNKASKKALSVVADKVETLERRQIFESLLLIKGPRFEGELPTQQQILDMGNGDSFILRLADGDEVVGEVKFTMREGALADGKRGLDVVGVKDDRNAIAPTLAKVAATIGAAIQNDKLVHPSDKTVVGMPLPVVAAAE